MTPLAIDLFCGLGGWTDGLLAEGYRVVGFDIERHVYGDHAYPAQLVIQDVLTLHGSQFRNAALIVASPPCQAYSYMAMPWSKAKQIAREYENGTRDVAQLTALFDACFRLQREASEAAGRHVPLVVENVRGAQRWVGRSRWNFGSFHLWGDVPALMPIAMGRKNNGGSWFNIGSPGQKETGRNPVHELAEQGVKVPTIGAERAIKRPDNGYAGMSGWGNGHTGSKSPARKAASALIAKIPLTLSRHIAKVYYPERAA